MSKNLLKIAKTHLKTRDKNNVFIRMNCIQLWIIVFVIDYILLNKTVH